MKTQFDSNLQYYGIIFHVCSQQDQRTTLPGERAGLTSSFIKGKPFLSVSLPAEHTQAHARAHTPASAHKRLINIKGNKLGKFVSREITT